MAERVEDQDGPSALARAILDGYPELNLNQAAVLAAAATVSPWVPRAAQAAGVSRVTVYGWLGRFPREQHRKSEAFCEAWPIFVRMGEENYLGRAEAMSEACTNSGGAAAPAVIARFMAGYDARFGSTGAAVQLDTQKVKRIILEREGDKP